MAGLVPAIHYLMPHESQRVDARDKRGHDESKPTAVGISRLAMLVHRNVMTAACTRGTSPCGVAFRKGLLSEFCSCYSSAI